MSVNVLYTTSVRVTGGRNGEVNSLDGKLRLKLSRPKELQGEGGDGTNPEQLFAGGYAACFLSSLQAVSGPLGVTVSPKASVTASVGIGPRSEGGFGLAVELKIELPGMDRAKADQLVEKAHHLCPYSNATRGNIDVKSVVLV